MSTTVTAPRRIIPDMGRKKATGGKHTTKRVNVGMPDKWHAIARKLAAKRQQPVTFLLIALLKAEAEAQGIGDMPTPPWEEDEGAEGG